MVLQKEKMILDGKEVEIERKSIPVEILKLNPENPRLRYIVNTTFFGKATDKELHDELWKKDSVKQLAEAIHFNGGLIEPIIIYNDGTVIEGNCRTVALRELVRMYPDDVRFHEAPSRLLPKNVSATQVAVFLVDVHVTGKEPWDAYEKARCVSELKEKYGKDLDWIAAHLRTRRNKITHLLEVYEKFEKFLERHPDPGNVKRYTFFDEFYKSKALRKKAAGDPDFIIKFEQWLLDGKLGDSHNVRKLPDILANLKAAEVLEKDGFDKAFAKAVEVDPTLDSRLFKKVGDLTEELRNIPMTEIEDLKSGNISKKALLQELKQVIERVGSNAGIKI